MKRPFLALYHVTRDTCWEVQGRYGSVEAAEKALRGHQQALLKSKTLPTMDKARVTKVGEDVRIWLDLSWADGGHGAETREELV